MMKYIYMLFINLFVSVHSWKPLGGNDIYDLPPLEEGTALRADTVSGNNITQIVDHFDTNNGDVFLQRYYVNTGFFNETNRNVSYLMIGGEGAISASWVSGGAWTMTAEKYGALLFYLEHRYYGQSHPFPNLSTANLRYLSSQQAVEDVATFIEAMNEEYNLFSNVKWVLFGGSYGGTIASWVRLKYPNLVYGAVSSSGPSLAKFDFHEYLQVVIDDLSTHSQECVEAVQAGVVQLEEAVNNPGDENITSLFKLCDDIEGSYGNVSDLSNLFEVVADHFSTIAQYNGNRGRVNSINVVCNILTNTTIGKELYRLSQVFQLIVATDCLDFKYNKLIETLQNTTVTYTSNKRQWYYQICTEFGWFQTSSQDLQIFGDRFPIEFFAKMCTDAFGPEFNATGITGQINEINAKFGGLDYGESNVIFVHGSFDPWLAAGITELKNSKSYAIIINGTAHCTDMYSTFVNDTPQLTAARQEINNYIGIMLEDTSGAVLRTQLWSSMFGCIVFLFFSNKILNVPIYFLNTA